MSAVKQSTRLGSEGRGMFSHLYEISYEGLSREHSQVKEKLLREIETYNMTRQYAQMLNLVDNFVEGKIRFYKTILEKLP